MKLFAMKDSYTRLSGLGGRDELMPIAIERQEGPRGGVLTPYFALDRHEG
ncbi:hypothetical protein [Haliangium sp. UPWRP_2]|nr:hypothetical protein [Haliangium sp. UPWRP_2]HNN93782.1 hypothetical protein [Pseudomonadota bacterium]